MAVVEKPVTLVKTCYKVGKNPYDRGVSVQDLQSKYKALEFLSALKQFLISRMTHDKVVLPIESDRFDVFSHIYVESGPSVVTGHGSVWHKIRARPKVAGRGRKAESPARFDHQEIDENLRWLYITLPFIVTSIMEIMCIIMICPLINVYIHCYG